MFTVLSALHWGPSEDTSSQPLFPRGSLLVTDRLGPEAPSSSLETLGLGEEWGAVCVSSITSSLLVQLTGLLF